MTNCPSVALLDDFRRSFVEGAPRLPELTTRLLLDTLGLGNRQVFDFLARARPSQAEFEAWIIDTAGQPDPALLSRYNSKMGRGEPSEAAQDHLRAITAMPDVLDAAELAQWEREGYVVVREALTTHECAALTGVLWDTIKADPDQPESWSLAESDGIMVPVYQHPAQIKARRNARIHKAFAQLWGTPDLWVTVDQMGFNPPERAGHVFRGSPVHWDVSLARPIPFGTQAVLYLSDTAEDQGAFRCVPGFHHRIEAWLDGPEGQNPRDADFEGEARCVPGKAGDLVIWRQDLPHGASPNRAAKPRLVQYLNYYSPGLEVREEWL